MAKSKDTLTLKGKLVSPGSWVLLTVPAAVCRGLFAALDEEGAEYPPAHGDHKQYNPHISVIRPEEIEEVGGKDKITELGQEFAYQLGPVQSVNPSGWDEMDKVWMVKVISQELKDLRKNHGLTALPNGGKFDFHVTFAVRKKSPMKINAVKAARFLTESELTTLGRGSELLESEEDEAYKMNDDLKAKAEKAARRLLKAANEATPSDPGKAETDMTRPLPEPMRSLNTQQEQNLSSKQESSPLVMGNQMPTACGGQPVPTPGVLDASLLERAGFPPDFKPVAVPAAQELVGRIG